MQARHGLSEGPEHYPRDPDPEMFSEQICYLDQEMLPRPRDVTRDVPRDPDPETRPQGVGGEDPEQKKLPATMCFTYVSYALNETVSGSGSLS